MAWTIPALTFPAEAGTHLPLPISEGWKAELAEFYSITSEFICKVFFYGTLHLVKEFRNFMELYDGYDGTEQLRFNSR